MKFFKNIKESYYRWKIQKQIKRDIIAAEYINSSFEICEARGDIYIVLTNKFGGNTVAVAKFDKDSKTEDVVMHLDKMRKIAKDFHSIQKR